MAKRPYITFYLGDYIKDTRILPLNVRGGWVDLILYMWENEPQGELTGTMQDFSRMMNCSLEEAVLVIQTLKEKKTFSLEQMSDTQFKIISRKQKKMRKISEIRQTTGKMGGNPKLTASDLDNQNLNLNAEYEYINTVLKEIEERGNLSLTEKQNYMLLITEMVKAFLDKNEDYFFEKETDYHACLQIAYNIAAMKKWQKAEITNGKMKDALTSWRTIIDFVKEDEWFKTRSLSDLSTTKEWQRLVQKMNGQKKGTEKKMHY